MGVGEVKMSTGTKCPRCLRSLRQDGEYLSCLICGYEKYERPSEALPHLRGEYDWSPRGGFTRCWHHRYDHSDVVIEIIQTKQYAIAQQVWGFPAKNQARVKVALREAYHKQTGYKLTELEGALEIETAVPHRCKA